MNTKASMEQYTVTFFVEKTDLAGNHKGMEKRVIRTGKTTIAEAAEVAIAHGANPFKNWKLTWEK
ncbi:MULTISPECIES: hypothetical protein [Muribaculaceae]|uniref:Uncharacterized protein n=2 Tax=Muribaculaceae TaxID=2005473 RepID=A0A4Z0V3K5_9BACT|nr:MULTISPECIES: hypothetical protein [Muribaculaceae]QCD37167.1 hypothetical protein E7746_14600 [Muribaculum gordoncarteri]TGG35091.1 hypothetical protein EZ315_15510 [Duncaniella freteri]